ncbi:hypothetical protein ASD25_09265 [Brevundimonas sp. Root1423]|nr:hypothetical protein ASD25_09265 [Brevundimonas sp. Root1423]
MLTGPTPALAQDPQTVPNAALQRMDKLQARLDGVRYENADGARPAVVLYLTIQNPGASPILLGANTFSGSSLAGAGTTATAPGYTFATGMRAGQEGSFAGRTLAPGASVLIAMRFALRAPLGSDYSLVLREQPLIRYPGQTAGAQTRISVPGPVRPGPLPADRLPTPSARPVNSGLPGEQTFVTSGPWRARMDEVVYGAANPRPGQGTGLTRVIVTLQNTWTTAMVVTPGVLSTAIVETTGARTPSSRLEIVGRSNNPAPLTVPPGESIALEAVHYMPDAPSQHRARQWALSIPVPGGVANTLTLAMPQPKTPAPNGDSSRPPENQRVDESVYTHNSSYMNLARLAGRLVVTSYNFINVGHLRNQMGVTLMVRNISGETVRLDDGLLTAELAGSNGRVLAHKSTGFHSGSQAPLQRDLAPGAEAMAFFSFEVGDEAAQRNMRTLTVVERAGASGGPEVGRMTINIPTPRLPGASGQPSPNPAPAPTPPPPPPPPPAPARYDPPADPAPTPAAEQAMRSLEGVWTTNLETQLALRYDGGLLRGQLRTAEGQTATATMTLALNAQGQLVGVMQRSSQSADTTWFAVNLTPSFDRSRLEGSAAYTHRPTNSPMPLSARREPPPPPAPSPTPPGGSVSGTGAFQPTAYFDIKVDRVGRTDDGSVEIVLVARNASGDRRGSPYDPQTYSLEGSDGMEYRTDGNHYGDSALDRPGSTNWIQPGAQSRVTYVFPRVPAGVTPARLILRENGALTAAFELPR